MKMMIRLALTMFVLAITLQASADCYVYVNICRPETGIGPGSFFKDYDSSILTQQNPNRCMERAREYLNYCAAPGGVAATYYYTNGNWKTAVVVAPGYSQLYVVDFANNWNPLKKNY